MAYDDVLTRNDNEELAVRVVSATESATVVNPNDVYTRDTDGNLAIRTVGNGGGSDPHNLGWYTTPEALGTAHPTADDGDWAIVGSTDTVWVWDSDTNAWKDSDQKGQVTSVNGQTGAVTVQETLVNQSNIKSVNGNSLLGSGNLDIDGLPSQTGNAGKFLITDGANASWSNTIGDGITIAGGLTQNLLSVLFNNQQRFLQTYYGSDGIVIFFIEKFNGTTSGVYRFGASFTPGVQTPDITIGDTNNKWAKVYTTKLNNGADINVPTTGGTLALTSDLPSTSATIPTLAVADWSNNTQTVTVTGVTASNIVFVSPAPASASDYASAGITCTAQETDSLTFTCTTVPSNAITVNVVIMG